MMYEDISRCHEVFVYKKIKVIHEMRVGSRKCLYNIFLCNSFHVLHWLLISWRIVRQVCSVCQLDITIDQNQLEKWVNTLSFIFP